MSFTLVTFHAHPDDEALLTAGTMAKAAAQGHRVVLVVATDGGEGLAAADHGHGATLAAARMTELQASADALGVARVVHLGYADSGMTGPVPPDPPGGQRFLRADPVQAAGRLAEVLRQERADVLTTYDANGGYGHRDHVRVHEVGALAADLAGTPRVLEATIPRDLIARAVELVAKVYRFPPEFDPTSFRRSFAPRSAITHRIDVRRYAGAKRAAMAAHASQASADGGADRTLAAFLRLPRPVFAAAFGHEWYVQSRGPGVVGSIASSEAAGSSGAAGTSPNRGLLRRAIAVPAKLPGGGWATRHLWGAEPESTVVSRDIFAGLSPRPDKQQ